jgi:putative membrane protein
MKLLGFNTVVTALVALNLNAMATTPQQRHFLRDTISGDSSEIGLALLAQQVAASPKVRLLGVQLVHDHMVTRADALEVARSLRITAPASLTRQARSEREQLRGREGRAFDAAFLRHVIADKREDIADIQAQARGRGPTARFAERTLPTLERTLRNAERLQDENT